MELWTDALDSQAYFDSRYTCDSDNSSPELRWRDPPPNTKSFALVCEDMDAPGGLFTHWVIYRIPGTAQHLPAGIPPQEVLPNGIAQGVNSLGKLGYGGPCPPITSGAHRYVFRLYACSEVPELAPRANRAQLLGAIQPLILGWAEFTGKYKRSLRKAG